MVFSGGGMRACAPRLAKFGIVCFAAAAISGLLAGTSVAAMAGQEPAGDDRVAAVIDRWRCPIAEYLDKIRHRPQKLDRYLVLWAKRRPDLYVQCIFHDEDRQLLCEAASGFYRYTDRIGSFSTPERLDALARLGFSTDGSKGNFTRDLDFHSTNETAALMVETLARVFGFDVNDVLEFSAPLLSKRKSGRVKVSLACAAISALNPSVTAG